MAQVPATCMYYEDKFNNLTMSYGHLKFIPTFTFAIITQMVSFLALYALLISLVTYNTLRNTTIYGIRNFIARVFN